MWRRIVAAVLSCGSAHAAESFTIRSATAVTNSLEVRYFLTGAFGGYGGFVRDPDKDGAYRIPLQQDGKPAQSLKAILYAPGCEFVLLTTDLTASPSRSATFACEPLAWITLRGKVSPPPTGAGALDVDVSYLSAWDHKFFGLADGMIQEFSLGKTPLPAGGRFQFRIPDFSKDRVTTQMQDACLKIRVKEHATWNILETVLPPASQRCSGGLKILPSFDSEIVFKSY